VGGEKEELTHRGQPLSEVEKFADPVASDDDSDDEDNGRVAGTSGLFLRSQNWGGIEKC